MFAFKRHNTQFDTSVHVAQEQNADKLNALAALCKIFSIHMVPFPVAGHILCV